MSYLQRQHHVLKRRAVYRSVATPTPPTPVVTATETSLGRIFVVPRRRIQVPVLREHPGIPVGKVRSEERPVSAPAEVAPVAEAAPLARTLGTYPEAEPAKPVVSVDQRAREYAEAAMLEALRTAVVPAGAALTGPTFDLMAVLTAPLEPAQMLPAVADDALIWEAIAIVDTLELEECC